MIKYLFRYLSIRCGSIPALVIVTSHTEFSLTFCIRAKWWATREDVVCAIAKAKSEKVLPDGMISYPQSFYNWKD